MPYFKTLDKNPLYFYSPTELADYTANMVGAKIVQVPESEYEDYARKQYERVEQLKTQAIKRAMQTK